MQGRSGQRAELHGRPIAGVDRGRLARSLPGALTLALVSLVAIASISSASELEAAGVATLADAVAVVPEPAPAPPSPGPAAIAPRLDELPSELSSNGRRTEPELVARIDAASPILMIERRSLLEPLVMEQPVRVYENDVTVKFTAPGGNSSFATVELVF